jgi:hypothetical protein
MMMAEHTHGFCSRCDREVEVEHRHPYSFRRKVRLYLYMPIILVPMFPFIAWDYVVALPIFMLYMMGIGPVLMIVRDPGVCVECGALVQNERSGALVSAASPSTP